MSHITTLAGSPSRSATSAVILNYARRILKSRGVHTSAIHVRDLPAEDLLFGRTDSPDIQTAICLIEQAQAVIIATPVYKAAYSGILKTFLDLLPQNALNGKTILPIATGGSSSHLPTLDYALKPVLSALGACHILRGVYVTDAQIQYAHGGVLELDDRIEQRLRLSLEELLAQREPAEAWRHDGRGGAPIHADNGARRSLEPESAVLLEGFER